MRKYLFFKIFKSIFLISTLIFILFYIFFVQILHNKILSNEEKNLKVFAYKIYNEVEEESVKPNKEFIEKLKEVDRYTGIRITFINVDGSVIIDTRENPKFMENHKNRPEIIDAIEKGEGKSLRLSPTLNQYMFYYAIFMKDKGIVLRVSTNVSDIQKFFYEFKRKFGVTFLLIYLIFTSLFIISISFSLKEISQIDMFINDLSKEKYGKILIDLKQKGLKDIVENLNYISERLSLVSRLEKEDVGKFEIIKFLEEPTAFFNLEGKLLDFNTNFEKFLKSSSIDKYFWEVIENFEINEIIEKTINLKKKQEKEVEIDGKWYFLKTVYLEKEKGIVLFMFDITLLKEAEKMRKDFITNISHELKTPLTIIKGYVETLEEETCENFVKNYANIIKKQIDRLINIVENMLSLSQLESKKIEFEDVDICKIVKNIYDLYKKKAEEKNLQFLLNISDIPLVKGDKFKLEQAIINLVDNAVKFTETGKVEININKEKKYVVIEVVDTGIGISEEELPKIFERFYVGSKRKSKAGIGIGLSIVKNIVELHNGKIEVESKMGQGTIFKIYLPLCSS